MRCNRVRLNLTSIEFLRHAQSPVHLVAVRALDGLLRHAFTPAPKNKFCIHTSFHNQFSLLNFSIPWHHAVRADACIETLSQPPPLLRRPRPPSHDVVVVQLRAVVAEPLGRFGAVDPAALPAPKSCVRHCLLALVTFALVENKDVAALIIQNTRTQYVL